jgi:hypothetical protein
VPHPGEVVEVGGEAGVNCTDRTKKQAIPHEIYGIQEGRLSRPVRSNQNMKILEPQTIDLADSPEIAHAQAGDHGVPRVAGGQNTAIHDHGKPSRHNRNLFQKNIARQYARVDSRRLRVVIGPYIRRW